MVIPVVRADESPKPDLVIVPAIGYKMPDALVNALSRSDIADASDLLRSWANEGARVAAGSVENMGHGRAASPSWGIRQHWRNAY